MLQAKRIAALALAAALCCLPAGAGRAAAAGGQETVGIAQTRPSASAAGMVCCGAKTAARTEQTGSASAANAARNVLKEPQ